MNTNIKDFEKSFDNFGEFVRANRNKLLRMWYKNEEESSLGANYIYIVGSIPIPNDILLLIRHFDDNYENNMYPHIDFIKLSDVSLTYYVDDQGEDNENEDK